MENKNIIIRIVTDYEPDNINAYNITKEIENLDLNYKKVNIASTISFGDDIMKVVDSNIAIYENVPNGYLIMDDPDNRITYGKNSFICNISAKSLKDLWDLEGDKGLLAMNLRYYVKSASIDDKIEESIRNDGENFWYLNNGIIIVCDDYSFDGNILNLNKFSIVNGGQTTRMVGKIPFDKDFYISCKVVKNNFERNEDKNLFVSKVAAASNTQKPIKPKDIIANLPEQRNLKTLLNNNKIFIEIKRGEKCNKAVFSEPWQRTKNNELAQDLYAFIFMSPGPARNNVSKILQNKEKYETLFIKHQYSPEFLKSLLILEKCYKQYAKKKKKEEGLDDYTLSFIKNGQFYTIATIGYILKIIYNKDYKNDVHKYRNNKKEYEFRSSQPAFNVGFTPNITYKEFTKISFEAFDFVINNIIMFAANTINSASSKKISMANWTKTNTGFEIIRNIINLNFCDNKDSSRYEDNFKKWFKALNDSEINNNLKIYREYCEVKEESKTLNASGNEMNENDIKLRNSLMQYRLEKSMSKGISENSIFSDKKLEQLIVHKPLTKESLAKILSTSTIYYCGEEILDIIKNNL